MKGVSFLGLIYDMGDIFFDATPWRKWLTKELNSCGVDISYDDVVRIWESMLVEVYKGRIAYWVRFNELLLELGLTSSESEKLGLKARRKGRELQKSRHLFKHVATTLAFFNEIGIKQAVLSDSELTCLQLRKLLKSLGIDKFLDEALTSFEIGYVKPEPEAYRIAAKSINVEIDRCSFIGHDSDELSGASAIGLHTIALNAPMDTRPDIRIKNFYQLKRFILNKA